MFLFESFLFASFIPQILMFFGLVSCLAAPFLPEKEATNSKQKNHISYSDTDLNSEVNETKQIHFHDGIDWKIFSGKQIPQAILSDETEFSTYHSLGWKLSSPRLRLKPSLQVAASISIRAPPYFH